MSGTVQRTPARARGPFGHSWTFLDETRTETRATKGNALPGGPGRAESATRAGAPVVGNS
ncbi:hypothetical protein GCM10010428_24780 [Actinosynnema pretiosum subsp. pretiosum]